MNPELLRAADFNGGFIPPAEHFALALTRPRFYWYQKQNWQKELEKSKLSWKVPGCGSGAGPSCAPGSDSSSRCCRAQPGQGCGCSVLVRKLQVLHEVVPSLCQLLQVRAGQRPRAAPPLLGLPGSCPAFLCWGQGHGQ